jgi:hypothetical protein
LITGWNRGILRLVASKRVVSCRDVIAVEMLWMRKELNAFKMRDNSATGHSNIALALTIFF